MTDQPVCPKCGSERDPVGDKYPPDTELFLCGMITTNGKPSRWQPMKCQIRQLTTERDELARKLGQAVSHLRDCTEGISDQAHQAGRARARAWLDGNKDWLAANDATSEGRKHEGGN